MAARKKIPSYIVPGLRVLITHEDGGFELDRQEAVVVDIDRKDEDSPIAAAWTDGPEIESGWFPTKAIRPLEGDAKTTDDAAARTEEQAARTPQRGDRWEHPTFEKVTVARVEGGTTYAYSSGAGSGSESWQAGAGALAVPTCDWWAFVADCDYLGAVEAPQ